MYFYKDCGPSQVVPPAGSCGFKSISRLVLHWAQTLSKQNETETKQTGEW